MNLGMTTTRLVFPCVLMALLGPAGTGAAITAVTDELVEAVVGQTLVLPCSWSVPGGRSSSAIPELGWFIRQGTIRVRIVYKEGAQHSFDPVVEYADRVSIKDAFTLVIDRALPRDSRWFTCQVSAGVEGVSESRTRVSVFSEPKVAISERAEPVEVTGELVEIADCRASNVYPLPNITWYKDDEQLNVSEEVKFEVTTQSSDIGLISATSTLKYLLKKTDRESNYHCVVGYNMPGQTLSKITKKIAITLHYPAEELELVVESPPFGVKEKDQVTMKCIADANPPPSFIFFKDGVQISLDSQNPLRTFMNINRDRTGNYTCHASGNVFVGGSEEQKLVAYKSLLVNYIDSLSVSLTPSQTIMVGQTLTGTCTLTANPELQGTYTWRKQNGEIVGEGVTMTKVTDYYDSGNFTCNFLSTNASGLQKEAAASISVHGKPMFASSKEDVTVQPSDQSVVLACEALGFPRSVVRWSLPTGTSTTSQDMTATGIISKVKITVSDSLPTSVTCIATNRHGETAKSFTLTRVKEHDDSTTVVVVIVVVCIIIAATIAVVLGLFFTKKACFAKKGSKTINKPESPQNHEEGIALRSAPNEQAPVPGSNPSA